MCYRKPRVHLTGKSNADIRTISTTPIKDRIPIQERSLLTVSNSLIRQAEDPIETSMKTYKS